ncbi:MAG: hypothetical protein A3B70_02080 [Deltaproteobacteria bacterium RIFCSPHIGHO2_02_FULL_40_11]|nr:MAG: hypothetical protein A3B70_02080 [Deltaproteobacteria bacterium RIFCSPHIGHO2_02_FULL_40_11]
MKKVLFFFLSVFFLSNVAFSQNEVVEFNAGLSVAKCSVDGSMNMCNYMVNASNVTVELKPMGLNGMWYGIWNSIQERDGHSFQATVSITRSLDEKLATQYNVRAQTAWIPEDGRSSLQDVVSVSLQVKSLDHLNQFFLEGNRMFFSDGKNGDTNPTMYEMYPVLVVGPKLK